MATKAMDCAVRSLPLSTGFASKSPKFRVSTVRCSSASLYMDGAALGLGERPWKVADAKLVLEDGSIWRVKSFSVSGTQVGEVVFNTS